MTTNDRPSPQQPPHRPGGRFFDSIRNARVYRPAGGRWIGGVSGAIADRTGLDLTLVRGLTFVVCLFFGIGILFYGLAWLFLPEPDGRIHAEGVLHGAWTAGFIGSCLVVLLGFANPGFHAPWSVFWPLTGSFFGWLGSVIVIGVIVALVVYAANHRSGPSHGRPRGPAAGPDAGPAGGPHAAGPDAGPGSGPASTPEPAAQSSERDPASTESAGQDESARSQPPQSDSAVPDSAQSDSAVPDDSSAFNDSPGSGDTTDFDAAPPNIDETDPTIAMPAAQPPPSAVGYASAAPVQPRRITKPAGGPMTLLVVGIALLGIAGGWFVDHIVGLPGDGRLIAVGAGIAIIGIGVVIAGTIGRRGGGLTGWAWCGIALAAVVAIVPMAGRLSPVSNSVWDPPNAAVASHGYSVGVGTTTVDLTDIDVPKTGTIDVPVNSGIGDVHVLLPPGVPAKVQQAGSGAWQDVSGDRDFNGSGTVTKRYGSGPIKLNVKVRMGIGTLSVDHQGVNR